MLRWKYKERQNPLPVFCVLQLDRLILLSDTFRESDTHHPDRRMGGPRLKRHGVRHISADTDYDGGRLALLYPDRSNDCEPHPYSVGQSDTNSSYGHPQWLRKRGGLVLVRFRSSISRVVFQRTRLTGWSLHLPLPDPSHHAGSTHRYR